MELEHILRKGATLMMSESEKLKYGMEHRGALEGYADADWWRALSIDINSLDDGIEKETLQHIKRIFTAILKAIDILRKKILTLG